MEWADEVVCMEPEQAHLLRQMTDKKVVCLKIQDSYAYRDPDLIKLIKKNYQDEIEKSLSNG